MIKELGNALFIINPMSRGGSGFRKYEKFISKYPHVFSEKPGHIKSLVSDLECSQPKLVVVVGGDGSFHEAIAGFDKNPKSPNLCIVPLPSGSGCDFARYIGAPSKWNNWLNWLNSATLIEHTYGLARWQENQITKEAPFVTAAGFGMPAEVITRINKSSKALGPNFTYVAESLKTILKFNTFNISARCDNKENLEASHALLICNTPYVGSGMMVAPSASYKSNNLEVVCLNGSSRLQMLKLLSLCYGGNHVGQSGVKINSCHQIIVNQGDSFGFELDGESYNSHGPVQVQLSERKFKTLISDSQ